MALYYLWTHILIQSQFLDFFKFLAHLEPLRVTKFSKIFKKIWGMHILLIHYYNGTPEPITAQLLLLSEFIKRDNSRVILVCSCVALPAVKPTGRVYQSVFDSKRQLSNKLSILSKLQICQVTTSNLNCVPKDI